MDEYLSIGYLIYVLMVIFGVDEMAQHLGQSNSGAVQGKLSRTFQDVNAACVSSSKHCASQF